jgi:hypothetical protein
MKARDYTTGRRFTRVAVRQDPEGVVVKLRADDSLAGAINRIAPEAVKLLQAAGVERDERGWVAAELLAGEKLADQPRVRAAHIADCAEFLKGVTKLPFGTPGLERERLQAAFALGRWVALNTVYGADESQRSVAGKAPRPARADPLRAELVEDLAVQRRQGRTLAQALVTMRDVAHGVRVVPEGASFRVSTSTSKLRRVLSARTLETLWAEAAKLKPKRRRPAISGR